MEQLDRLYDEVVFSSYGSRLWLSKAKKGDRQLCFYRLRKKKAIALSFFIASLIAGKIFVAGISVPMN